MTLYKQLLITMLLLFALLFAVAYSVQFNSTRSYLAEQQQMTLNNTTTALGLALTPYLENGDKVGAESVINAVFDGGYYRQITLEWLSTGEMLERKNSLDIENVPTWFIKLNLFAPMQRDSILTSGWLQLGKIEVVGHPGQAYFELWQGMSSLFIWFIGAFFVTTLLLAWALKHLLKPLRQIRTHAEAISQHHFGPAIALPATVELQSVVRAINAMSNRLETDFNDQAKMAEALREQAYRDAVSGLGNRNYFNGQLSAWIAEEGQGGIMLLAVDILEDLYRKEGFVARDQMVASIAEIITLRLKTFEGHALARISSTEFAMLLPGLSSREMRELADALNQAIAGLLVNPAAESQLISVAGIAMRSEDESLSNLLNQADRALQQARTEAKSVVISRDAEQAMGRLEWKSLVQQAIVQDQFDFKVQPVARLNQGELLHQELLTCIATAQHTYGAGQFMPAVEQFRIGSEFDRRVLELVLPLLYQRRDLKLAVNLSRSALTHETFRSWLADMLDQHKAVTTRLSLELPESALTHASREVGELVAIVRRAGFGWGVDQFGRNFQSLGYLSELRPDYVKIDHSYTLSLIDSRGDNAFLAAAAKTAHKVGALTVVTRVENDEVVAQLAELGIDAYQGFIRPPTPLEWRGSGI